MSLDEYKVWAQVKPLGEVPESTDIAADLLKLMASPNLASRRWIWEQYDQSVGGDTVQRPGGDAAVVRVHGSKKALAITTDCTPRYCYADPYEGGKQAVAEAYRNLCAVGARPLAVTNCLNFGNPQRPEIMAQFVECLRGMGDACRALDFPIVSGNVSLYNESKATGGGSAILPTPAIGGVGLLDDWEKSATIGFKDGRDAIFLVGRPVGNLGQSLWLREIHNRKDGPPPPVDLNDELRTGDAIRELIQTGAVSAVHDISDGGIAVACAEMCLVNSVGAHITLPEELSFFAEYQACFLVSIDNYTRFCNVVYDRQIPHQNLGGVIGRDGPYMNFFRGDRRWGVELADLRAAHEGFFPKLMGSELTPEF
jgi:phosphoribosylformylglycinamidine synthase